MDLTIVVPFYNGHATIGRLLDSLPGNLPVVVVDDDSATPFTTDRPHVRTIRTPRGYFAGAVNAGAAACQGDFLILNQDARLEGAAWLDWLAANREQYACIGDVVKGHPAWPQGYVQGTFMYVRRDAWEKVGLFDARWFPLWGGTCDWQVRACRRGFKVLPAAVPGLTHGDGTRQSVKLMNGAGVERGRLRVGTAIAEAIRQEPGKMGLFVRTPPLVSIIVPCYNHGRYLPDLVASLIGGPSSLGVLKPQTFQGFEIVIVDDASTDDDTAQIAQSLADPWQAIRYIRREVNGGTAAANNTGIRASFGPCVTVLGADDMMAQWRLETLFAALMDHPGKYVYDRPIRLEHGQIREAYNLPGYNFCNVLRQNAVPAGILYPRRAWELAGGYPEAMRHGREDWAFNVALGLAGYHGVLVEPPGYLYRRDGQNRTLTNTTPDWRRRFLAQLHQLFPNVYNAQGEVMYMACCGRSSPSGGNKRTGSGGQKSAGKPTMPGSTGMTVLEYIGRNAGTMTWWGPVSGARYLAGGSRRVFDVDTRDLTTGNMNRPGLLEVKESGQPQFRKHTPPPPVPPHVLPRDLATPTVADLVEPVPVLVEEAPLPVLAEVPKRKAGRPKKGLADATA